MLRRTFLLGAATLASCAGPRMNAVPAPVAEGAYPPIGSLVNVGGLNVHATDEGHGGTPVILLHGANVNLRDWTHTLTAQLARHRRVIAMDRPGFGYSERDASAWTPARQAEQLRRAAHAMGAERPIIVGHSWGAIVALAWALEAPDEVSGVVSVSGATMPWGLGADIINALGVGRLGAEYYMASLSRRAEDGAIEKFVTRAFQPQTPPPGYLDYVGAPLSMRAGTIAANSEDLGQIQSALSKQSERYPDLRVPVEIIHGEIDWLLDVDRHALGLAERVPDATVSIAPGVGHMAHHARPDLLEEAIARLSTASA